MGDSHGKRILKWAGLAAPWLLALLLAAGWGLSAWTPGYLETLVPRLAREMGLPLEEFHIRGAGLFSANIGPVRLGPQDGGLRIDNVRVTYTPALLKARRVDTIELSGVALDARYDGRSFSLPVLDLLPASGDSSDKTIPALPFDSLIITDSTLRAEVNGTPLSIPFSATISPGDDIAFTAELSPRDQSVSLSGALGPTMNDLTVRARTEQLRLGAFGDLLPVPLAGEVDLTANASADLTRPMDAEADVRATIHALDLPDSGVQFDSGPVTLDARFEKQAVHFSLSPLQVAAPWPARLTISEASLAADTASATFALETAGVSLPGSVKATRSGDHWQADLTAANDENLTVDTGGRKLRLGGIDLSLSGPVTPTTADVVLTASTRRSSLDGVPASTGPIAVSLPLAWPAPKQHSSGSLRIAGLRYDKHTIGTMVARLRQESMAVGLDGMLYSQLLPDLRVKLSGSASMKGNDATFRFDLPSYVLTEAFNPATLNPALKGISVSGNLSVEGSVDVVDGDLTSYMGAFLTGGTATIRPVADDAAAGTVIHGIRLYFESPDLIDFRSAPAQLFSFDRITAGPVDVGKGVVTFQLEPRGVLLVERLGFDWVGGHVASRAFRVVPGHEEYDVTLFCSELRLASLLMQLGLADAKGEAALSGELPVTWKRGKISFRNGFLHSTPGEGGSIQVDAMQDLVSAIPKGTPQRGQLELAREAIKDFEYKWVRIKADTVGDDLLVRLSLDGKPARTLPFVYTKEFGGFARVTGDVKGSNFQGLRLDVNFSLPLDRILLYKDIINMIE